MTDKEYLHRAVELSKKSAEPVPCACILVQGGQIIAETFNSQRQDNVAVHHAEVKAIKAANEATGQRKLKATTAYCSCEPCAMCLTALSLAGVERIVYSQTMREVAPDDPLSQLDSAEFALKYLRFAPKLEQMIIED